MCKNKLLICSLIVILLISGGCWSLEEIEDLAIVGITGLDKVNIDNNERWQVNSKIIKPGSVGGGGGGGGQQQQDGEEAEWLVTGTGITISEATNNILSRSSRVVDTAHTNPYIIGEDVARRGILSFIDYVMRDPDMRQIPWLLAAEGKASTIIETEPNMENLLSDEVKSLIENSLNRMNKAPRINIKDFVSALALEGRDAVIPRISIATSSDEQENDKTVQISGMAVFKNDRLAGWMNTEETKGYLYITGDAQQEIISLNHNEQASVFMKNFSSNIDLMIQDGRVNFPVEINAKAFLDEYPAGLSSSDLDLLEEQLTKKIKSRAEKAIRKARDEYKSDIFGFGETLHKKNPSLWNENKENWYDIYSAANITISVDAQIVNTGMIRDVPEITSIE